MSKNQVKTTRPLLAGIIFLIIFALFSACSNQNADSSPNHLKVGLAEQGVLNTLDPARAGTTAPITIVLHMYDRLIDIGADGSLIPSLSTTWHASADLLTWEFVLRENATFQGIDNAKVTAADVKFSIERALRIPGLGRTLLGGLLEGADTFMSGKSETIEGITISKNKIIFQLTKPFAFLPDRLAITLFSIVPAHTPDETKNAPPGSGPYQLTEWDRTTYRVTLKKNSDHFIVSPDSPESIEFYIFEDTAAAVQELKAGTIQWLEGSASALDLLQNQAKDRLIVNPVIGLDYKLVAFNMAKGRFSESDANTLSKALNYAVDRKKIAELFKGSVPVFGPLPVGPWKEKGYHFDESKTKALVEKLPPEKRTFHLLVEPGSENRRLAEVLAQQWEAAGINVTLEQGQSNFFPRLTSGDYEAALTYFGPLLPTAEQYFWPFREASIPIPNVMGYVSEQFKAADSDLVTSQSKQVQDQAIEKALDVIIEDASMVWLLHPPRCTATSTDLKVDRLASLPKFWTCKGSN
ncbi:MAG: ABC transporter substrate-binding protein [Desulfotignum sp.]|nr:ABC transporter substrate-binding protein [Desulfotignum sp.]